MGCAHHQRRGLNGGKGRAVSSRRRCRVSSMVVAPSPEAERPRERAAAAPALLPRIGCRQRRSDQRRREWRSGQRPMQRPLRRVHLLAVCQPAVPNLSGGGRGTKPPGRYSALKPPICTRQHPRQTQLERSIRPCCIICLGDTESSSAHNSAAELFAVVAMMQQALLPRSGPQVRQFSSCKAQQGGLRGTYSRGM